jgi:hypothetical protein
MAETAKRYNSILKIIDDRLVPDEGAKKARGEVFTPLNLVREMLFGIRKSSLAEFKGKMPQVRSEEYLKLIWGVNEKGEFIDDDEDDRIGGIPLPVWRNPETKWLDPANGIGNFPVVAFYMIDYQLANHGPAKFKGDGKKNTRRTHIIKNMLYMLELNKGNVNTSRKIFEKIVPGVTANICCTDSLEISDDKLEKLFGVNRFHVIIGNPPFQAYQEASGKRGGGDELYMKFVNRSLDLLKDNCYLVFVHPPSWRKPEYSKDRKQSKNKGMFKLMAHTNQMVYLEMHDTKDGNEVFKAGTRYDFYVIKKIKSSHHTTIKDIHGNISSVDLQDFDFLPNYNFKNIVKLFPKKGDTICELGEFNEVEGKYENKECILYERSVYGGDKAWVSKTKSSSYIYPLIHTTPQGGPIYMYSSTNKKGHFGVPKVIFGDSGINEPIIDIDGKYGMTQHSMAIAVKNITEAENLSKFLKSNYFSNVLSACMWSSFQIDWRLFTYFKRNFWDIDVDLDEPLLDSKGEEKIRKPPKTARAKKGGARKPRRFTRRKSRN